MGERCTRNGSGSSSCRSAMWGGSAVHIMRLALLSKHGEMAGSKNEIAVAVATAADASTDPVPIRILEDLGILGGPQRIRGAITPLL